MWKCVGIDNLTKLFGMLLFFKMYRSDNVVNKGNNAKKLSVISWQSYTCLEFIFFVCSTLDKGITRGQWDT